MSPEETGIKTYDNAEERAVRGRMMQYLKNTPIPEDQLLSNLGLFLSSKNLSRILFMDHLYRLAVDIPGVVMEFGVRWGQNCALFAALRGIYEPFNRHRKIIGFDTFEGFPSVAPQDGASDMIYAGNLSVTAGYKGYLEGILSCQEQDNPLGHIIKFDLRKGDACPEIERYLTENPQTIVALAYFDFDLYEPTKRCLEMIGPRLVKGSVIGFDELNDPDSPGETLALMDAFGLRNVRLKRYRYASRVSYFVVE
ncbi:MAG: crotonobetainyl-CoA--carnitine CoA-transferase [Deltaproteobacteria bacterium RBG_13_53_10]|nr:MAG: crotonobetainyl-CoA--carnitine CoA-transferase [Deltaproteobacteria bacterium RBG_13_53_10]